MGRRTYRLQVVCHWLILVSALVSLIVLRLDRPHYCLCTWTACTLGGIFALCTIAGGTSQRKGAVARWRHLLCWLGFFCVMYWDMLTVEYGLTSGMEAGVFALMLLAAALFFTGMVDQFPLALCGMTVAVMVSGTILLHDYLFYVMVVPPIIMGYIIFLLLKSDVRRMRTSESME